MHTREHYEAEFEKEVEKMRLEIATIFSHVLAKPTIIEDVTGSLANQRLEILQIFWCEHRCDNLALSVVFWRVILDEHRQGKLVVPTFDTVQGNTSK